MFFFIAGHDVTIHLPHVLLSTSSTVFGVTVSKSVNKLLPGNLRKREQNYNQMQSTSMRSHDKQQWYAGHRGHKHTQE